MELWDIYNCSREKTGETMKRGSRPRKNKRHLVINVCIINSENKMLIQKRTDNKEVWPSMWQVTVSGSAVRGENSSQAAKRELFEELGILRDFKFVAPKISITSQASFRDFYILHEEIDISQLVLQKEEVADVKWASKEEIKDMINKKIFIPNYDSFIDLLFEID